MRSLAITALLTLAITAGCGAHARETALHTMFVTTNAACDSFAEYDLAKQKEILEAEPTPESFNKAIGEYSVQRGRAVKACEATYKLIAFALLLGEGEMSLAKVAEAIAKLREALHDFSGGVL